MIKSLTFKKNYICQKERLNVPNIKSAKKRTLIIEKKTAQNKMIKSEVKTEIKKFLAAVNSGDKETATSMFPGVCSLIASAVSKGVCKKNTAAL